MGRELLTEPKMYDATSRLVDAYYKAVEERLLHAVMINRDFAMAATPDLIHDCLTWQVEYLEPGTKPTEGRDWIVYRLEDVLKP